MNPVSGTEEPNMMKLPDIAGTGGRGDSAEIAFTK